MQPRHNRHYRDRVLLCTGHCASEKAQSEYIVSRDTRRRLLFANTLLGSRERCGGRAYCCALLSPAYGKGLFILQRTRKSIILLLLALALLFTGCTAGAADQAVAGTENQTIVADTDTQTAATNSGSKATIGAKTTAAQTGTRQTTTGKASRTTAKSGGKQTASGKTTATTRAANSAKWQGGSADLIPTGGKTTAQQQTTKKQTTTQSKTVTCTITVECKNIQNHMGQLKGGHKDYVPEDGYIIRAESHTVERGSTAYDVLKLACNAHGIRLTTKNTSYGVYVVGINNLDEKDCGSASGWMYKVNGTAPMTSCGKYKMDSGDNLVFYYVCTAADR